MLFAYPSSTPGSLTLISHARSPPTPTSAYNHTIQVLHHCINRCKPPRLLFHVGGHCADGSSIPCSGQRHCWTLKISIFHRLSLLEPIKHMDLPFSDAFILRHVTYPPWLLHPSSHTLTYLAHYLGFIVSIIARPPHWLRTMRPLRSRFGTMSRTRRNPSHQSPKRCSEANPFLHLVRGLEA